MTTVFPYHILGSSDYEEKTFFGVFCFVVLDPDGPCLDNYSIHTVTGLVKRWLRELPDPLMTFSLYSDFLHAVGEEIFIVC